MLNSSFKFLKKNSYIDKRIVDHKYGTNSPQISVKSGAFRRADVGIGPYKAIWRCIRIRIGFMLLAAAYGDLSVSFADSSPERGAFGAIPRQCFVSEKHRPRKLGRGLCLEDCLLLSVREG